MRKYLFVLFIAAISVIASRASRALEITGGKLEDIVVADSGSSDSTLVTRLKDGWLAEGPNSFDVDQQGNIYILDQIGGRVLKFSKDGKWLSTIALTGNSYFLGRTDIFDDIAVDTSGNIFINRFKLMKFSPEGKLLCQSPSTDNIEGWVETPIRNYILVDRQGKLYTFSERKYQGGIAVYDSKCNPEVELGELNDYYDIGIVQRDVGNDIYYREEKYLVRTNLEEFKKGNKPEIVAEMPNKLRLDELIENEDKEAGITPPPLTFLGFDEDSCFYFDQVEYLYNERWVGTCLTHDLYKYHLEDGKLKYISRASIDFERGKPECSDKELFKFRKQFVVSGDGTIYFLHGTVDKIKVSKITME
jgi:hypothetical protein